MGMLFCKQNGLLLSSLICRLSIQHNNRILWRDKAEFRSEMYSNTIKLLSLRFCGVELFLGVTVVLENGKNVFIIEGNKYDTSLNIYPSLRLPQQVEGWGSSQLPSGERWGTPANLT